MGRYLQVALPLHYITQNALKSKNLQSAAIWCPEIYNLDICLQKLWPGVRLISAIRFLSDVKQVIYPFLVLD